MKRKICAILLVLGVIFCQIPQTAVAAENSIPETKTEEADAVTETEEVSADIQEKDTQVAVNDRMVTAQGVSQLGEESGTSGGESTCDPGKNAKRDTVDSSEKPTASENDEKKGFTDDLETEQAKEAVAPDPGNAPSSAAETGNETNEKEVGAKSTALSEAEPETPPLRTQSVDPVSDVSKEPADTEEGLVRSAGGQYAINMYYNTSWGTVVAKVDDVVATSADGGDLVYLTITPASGYEFQSAGVIVRNSDQESVRTVPQADGTISFQMPNSAATVTVQFTIAEDDEPATPTPVDEVSLFVSQPAVGETTDEEAPDVTALDWMYEVTDTSWVDSSGNALSAPLTFESEATYYIVATVESYWESDATYFFPQSGDMAVSVENGSLVGTPSITNVYGAASTMQVLIAVQPVVRRSADQVQIWIGSIDGNTTMAQSGGKVATSYTPSEPNIYDFGKNGEYYAGDIVQFYSGDEITVTAQADAGHRFVGWYRVNIDYNMSGGDADHNGSSPNKAYSGSAFSTVARFTYKPGETVLSGDAEPLRYVCAVFEDDAAPSHNANEIQVWIGDVSGNEPGDGYAGGMVAVTYKPSYDDYPEDVVAKDGTVYERGPIFGCYEGDEVTLTARPDTGYRFAGWYLADGEWPANGAERYTGDRLSDQTTYTFEFTGANRLICAVFEENEAETCTVSFDPGTGTGSMDPVTVDAGAEYELPVCSFEHANTQRSFYKWSVDGELMVPGDTITVNEDTTVTAKWFDKGREKTIDNSVDRSNTEVAGTLKLTDTRTGEVTEVVAFDEVTASEFTQPSNITVQAMIGDAKESAAAKAQEIAAGHNVTIVSENVSDPRIEKTIDNRTHKFFVDADDAGDYAMYLIIDGDWAHLWRYDVTVEAEYTSGVTATLHWSSADGVDLMEPVVVEADPGMRLDDALTAAGRPYIDLFSKAGYADYGYRSLHPVDSFADEDAFYDDCIAGDYLIENDTDIYVVMFKELDTAEISIAPPVCGSTAAPAVSIAASECSADRDPIWIKDIDSPEPYTGELVGGNVYLAEVWLAVDFRYFFADDVQITVNGGKPESSELTLDDRIGIIAKVTAEHDPADPVEENVAAATCNEPGSHEDVVYCKACGEEIRRTAVEDSALGHDFGNWTVVKEPTCTEPGEEESECTRCSEKQHKEVAELGHDWSKWKVVTEAAETEDGMEQRECERCGETETRAIPHLVVEYRNTEGDGSSWEKGSTDSLAFVFKRNINNETTFSHFTGIQVDGNTVEASNYTAMSGSVEITLKPAFLESLSVGKHSLATLFDDADAVTVSFSVTEKATVPADNNEKKDTSKADAKKTDAAKTPKTAVPITSASAPNTGDSSNIGVWVVMLTAAVLSLVFILRQRRRYKSA